MSQDPLFNKNLRTTLLRHLHIKDDCVFNVTNQEQLHKELRQLLGQNHKVVFFVEREINGKYCHDLVQFLKNQYPDVLIIILTGEVAREILIYLHEIGANNVITKPISPDMLIEKIAFTVKPRGQIGELIEAGRKLNETGKFDDAATLAHKILEIKPGSPAALLMLGDSFKGQGKMDEALNAYMEASRNGKLFLDPIKKIAELHKLTGNVREETKYLERLDKLSPLNVDRKISIGDNYMSLGEREKAVEIFDDAIKLATKEALAQVGRVTRTIAEHCISNAPELSEKYLRQSLESKKGMLDKSDIETFNRLGITLRKQGKPELAIEEYRKALKIAPNDAGLYYNMAMAYSEGRQFQDAFNFLDKALTISPDLWNSSETVCFNIATVFFRAARKERATEYLQKALSINPNFERAKAMLREL
ncbi:MAG: tetratricopeptide repeat protein [Acidobacteriota bacterium]